MSRVNTLQLPDHVGYLLEFEQPRTEATTVETYASLAALVARAGPTMQAGYRIGIWSPAALEQRKK
jgi:hypothetical protein